MKARYIVSIILGSGLLLASCEKMDFLEIKPVNNVLTEDAIKTTDDLQRLMLSAYNQVRSAGFMGGTALVASDVLTDDAVTSNGTFDWTQIVAHAMDLFNPPGRNSWERPFSCTIPPP